MNLAALAAAACDIFSRSSRGCGVAPELLLRAVAFLPEQDALSVAFCTGGLLPLFAAVAPAKLGESRCAVCAWQARQTVLRRAEAARASPDPRLAELEQFLSQTY